MDPLSTVDDIARYLPGPASWKPTRNLPELDDILRAHATQADGTCLAGCNWAGVLWQGGCPAWADAYRERARILLDRQRDCLAQAKVAVEGVDRTTGAV